MARACQPEDYGVDAPKASRAVVSVAAVTALGRPAAIRGGAARTGYAGPVTDLLTAHHDLLERRRGVMNLVGPGPIAPHYEDAERGLAGLSLRGRWADLGTGAGFPGIVIAARFPDVALDLVDSRQKRCTFLEAALADAREDVRARPAPLRVVNARVEDLPAGAYDGVAARAFAPPDEVARHADRLLRPDGQLLLFLQADQPGPAGWRVVTEVRYAHEGRDRRTLLLIRPG